MTKNFRQRGLTLLELTVVVAILVVLASVLLLKTEKIREDSSETAARSTLTTLREALAGSSTGPGFLADMKYVPGFNPATVKVRDLLDPSGKPAYDPVAQRGWRGPYLSNAQPVTNTNPGRNGFFPAANERRFNGDATFLERNYYESASDSPYGEAGDPAASDPWGNPMVLQTPPASEFPDPTPAKRALFSRVVSAGPDGVLNTPRDRLAGMLPDGTTQARGDDLVLFLNRADIYEP